MTSTTEGTRLRKLWSWLTRSTTNAQATARAVAEKGDTQSITESVRVIPKGDDYRFAGPTHQCLCGCDVFIVLAWFQDYEIGGYFTDALCAACGSELRAPTPVDAR